jgi:hypothetical protein
MQPVHQIQLLPQSLGMRATPPAAAPAQHPHTLKICSSQFAERAQQSGMWDPEKCHRFPLILGKSDRCIKFTAVKKQRAGQCSNGKI